MEKVYASNTLSREVRIELTKKFIHKKSPIIRSGSSNKKRQNPSIFKCLISTGISYLSSIVKNFGVRIVVFFSPPKKVDIYSETLNTLGKVDYTICIYDKNENKDLERLQKSFKRSFFQLQPPEVDEPDIQETK